MPALPEAPAAPVAPGAEISWRLPPLKPVLRHHVTPCWQIPETRRFDPPKIDIHDRERNQAFWHHRIDRCHTAKALLCLCRGSRSPGIWQHACMPLDDQVKLVERLDAADAFWQVSQLHRDIGAVDAFAGKAG